LETVFLYIGAGRKMIKYLRMSTLVIFLILPSYVMAGSEKFTPHPDGQLGRISPGIKTSYSVITTSPEDLINDKTDIDGIITYPFLRNMTLAMEMGIINGDTLFYDFSAGIKLYFGNPTAVDKRCNPDGPLGLPVFNLLFSVMLADIDIFHEDYNISASLLMPIGSGLSLGVGRKYYNEKDVYQVDEFFGILHYFPAAYPNGAVYENPDGIDGVPSFYLSGGGSEHGIFGLLDIRVPLSKKTTLSFTARGERAADPYCRNATVGVGIIFYNQ
jgi:hypothetical protein